MVRIKSSGSTSKAAGSKMTNRKALSTPTGSPSRAGSSANGSTKYSGGNPICKRPKPEWQKSIGTFFNGEAPEKDIQEKSESDKKEEEMEAVVLSDSDSADECGTSSTADKENMKPKAKAAVISSDSEDSTSEDK